MILEIVLTASIIVNIALVFVAINSVKKIETYENWIDETRQDIGNYYTDILLADEKNLFEKDDDVGFAFSEIVRIAKEFKQKVDGVDVTTPISPEQPGS